ncbi:MAG TPA: helix-turn-helix transcriptional regulator [Longimicrobium sp.]
MSAHHQDASEFFREFEGNPEYERERAIARAQNAVGYNVNRLRRRAGLTQVELAGRAGMRQPRIAEIERGEYNPRLDTLAKLAWGLGATMEELTREQAIVPVPAVPAAAKVVCTDVVDNPFDLPGNHWPAAGRVRTSWAAANNNFALAG